jgi:hypothetical protein
MAKNNVAVPAGVQLAQNVVPLVLALFTFVAVQWGPRAVFTTQRNQALVLQETNFLPEDIFGSLQTIGAENNTLVADNKLSLGAFSDTKGFVVRFSISGLDHVRAHPEIEKFLPYFERVRIPEANAWVMNLLICEPGTAGDVVKPHLDNSLETSSVHEFYAHQVNVLYLHVPSEMDGGRLELWEFSWLRWVFFAVAAYFPSMIDYYLPADAVVQPEVNKMVKFRGDAFHRVQRYSTESSASKRVSLVVEQYIVSAQHFGSVGKFSLHSHSEHYS